MIIVHVMCDNTVMVNNWMNYNWCLMNHNWWLVYYYRGLVVYNWTSMNYNGSSMYNNIWPVYDIWWLWHDNIGSFVYSCVMTIMISNMDWSGMPYGGSYILTCTRPTWETTSASDIKKVNRVTLAPSIPTLNFRIYSDTPTCASCRTVISNNRLRRTISSSTYTSYCWAWDSSSNRCTIFKTTYCSPLHTNSINWYMWAYWATGTNTTINPTNSWSTATATTWITIVSTTKTSFRRIFWMFFAVGRRWNRSRCGFLCFWLVNMFFLNVIIIAIVTNTIFFPSA